MTSKHRPSHAKQAAARDARAGMQSILAGKVPKVSEAELRRRRALPLCEACDGIGAVSSVQQGRRVFVPCTGCAGHGRA